MKGTLINQKLRKGKTIKEWGEAKLREIEKINKLPLNSLTIINIVSIKKCHFVLYESK